MVETSLMRRVGTILRLLTNAARLFHVNLIAHTIHIPIFSHSTHLALSKFVQ